MVMYEAARAICNLPGVEMNDLSPAINVLQVRIKYTSSERKSDDLGIRNQLPPFIFFVLSFLFLAQKYFFEVRTSIVSGAFFCALPSFIFCLFWRLF